MNSIEVGLLDPSYTHFGVVRARLDLETLTFTPLRMETICTEPADKATKKVVRKSSTNLSRCKTILRGYIPIVQGCTICFSELPGGAKSAHAMWSFGAATMAVAACPVPVIQVQPDETKLAATGSKHAGKDEIIEWAVAKYPDAPWRRYDRDVTRAGKVLRKKGQVHTDEEHVADALAVGEAGLKTDQFLQLLALLRSKAA